MENNSAVRSAKYGALLEAINKKSESSNDGKLSTMNRVMTLELIAESYQNNEISLHEYNMLKDILLHDKRIVKISEENYEMSGKADNEKVERFREKFLALMGSDKQIRKAMSHVVAWSAKIGVPQEEIKRDYAGVAIENLEEFFKAGELIGTVFDCGDNHNSISKMNLI